MVFSDSMQTHTRTRTPVMSLTTTSLFSIFDSSQELLTRLNVSWAKADIGSEVNGYAGFRTGEITYNYTTPHPTVSLALYSVQLPK